MGPIKQRYQNRTSVREGTVVCEENRELGLFGSNKLSSYPWISVKQFARRHDCFQRRLPHGRSLCQPPMAVVIPVFHATAGGGRRIDTVSGRQVIGVAIRFRPGASGAPRDRDAGRPGARGAPRARRLLRVLELRRRLQRFLRRSRQDDLALLLLQLAHRHRDLMLSDAEQSADSDDRV
jgi:hypothetical protein